MPHNVTLGSKRERRGLRDVSHLLLGNWLGSGLPVGGGERLPLHHFVFFLSSTSRLLIKQFLSLPASFLGFSLSVLFLHPTGACGATD